MKRGIKILCAAAIVFTLSRTQDIARATNTDTVDTNSVIKTTIDRKKHQSPKSRSANRTPIFGKTYSDPPNGGLAKDAAERRIQDMLSFAPVAITPLELLETDKENLDSADWILHRMKRSLLYIKGTTADQRVKFALAYNNWLTSKQLQPIKAYTQEQGNIKLQSMSPLSYLVEEFESGRSLYKYFEFISYVEREEWARKWWSVNSPEFKRVRGIHDDKLENEWLHDALADGSELYFRVKFACIQRLREGWDKSSVFPAEDAALNASLDHLLEQEIVWNRSNTEPFPRNRITKPDYEVDE